MRAIATATAIVSAVLISAAAQAAKPPQVTPNVIGPDVGCVQLRNIRETRVRDDETIDFIMRDGRWFRNTLPNRCPQLGFNRAFSYQTSISQLCNVDIITVLIQGAGIQRGASCGLGKFTPIEPIKKAAK
jgi:hypothetical protein